MASEGEYLKEFLVGVGFKIDENTLQKFNKTLGFTSNTALNVGLAVAAAGAAVAAFTTKMAVGLEDLYWASQRVGSSVTNIKGFDYAIESLGGTAGGARAMLEGLASAMRSNPGVEAMIGSLGVKTRESNGAIRDRVKVLTDLGNVFRNMPFFEAKQYAEILGIYTSDADLLALEKGPSGKIDQLASIYKQLGIDADKTAADSHEFMNNLRLSEGIVGALALKFESELLPSINHAFGALLKYLTDIKSREQTNKDTSSWVHNMLWRKSSKNGHDLFLGIWDPDPHASSSNGSAPANDNAGDGVVKRNNAGNLRSWGNAPQSGGFAKFNSALQGISAAAGNLAAYSRHGWNTVNSIISHWAPPGENDTAAYIKDVASRLHVGANQALNLSDPRVMQDILSAIFRHEQGFNPYSSALIAQGVNSRLSGSIAVSQHNEVHIHGGDTSDQQVAKFERALKEANGTLLRDLKGSAR